MILDGLQKLIQDNVTLQRIREKVIAGTSTIKDCNRYNILASKILGDYLGDQILLIPMDQRQEICVMLMENRYDDIITLLNTTEVALDDKAGIHVGIVTPDFNLERAMQIGGSLTDETADDSTIIRRAKAAPATATKQVVDDWIKVNAETRDLLGFETEVIRTADSNCCKWCSDVAGVYLYSKQPDGIWRRHDNCDCTIDYRTARVATSLRGSGKKWIEVQDTLHILKGD